MLVVAAEDYSGISPAYKKPTGRTYLSYYLDALAANGYAADVYDVDANGRAAPSPLGVLGHYDAVIWYTGDDVITRDAGMVPGTASRLANDEMLAMRQYIDEGGRLLFTGKYAGLQYAQGYEFDLEHGLACDPNTAADGCEALSDDFLQYYLGAYLYNDDAGTKANGGSTTSWASRPVRRPLVVVRRAEREQPGPQRLVHRDQRDPARSRSTRSSTAGRPRSTTGRAARSIRTPAPTTRTRRSRTSRTSG